MLHLGGCNRLGLGGCFEGGRSDGEGFGTDIAAGALKLVGTLFKAKPITVMVSDLDCLDGLCGALQIHLEQVLLEVGITVRNLPQAAEVQGATEVRINGCCLGWQWLIPFT